MDDRQTINNSTSTIEDYLDERAKRGSKIKFDAIMAKVPDIEPLEYDKIV